MESSIRIWRIAVESAEVAACDLSGRGAERTGGRWNRPGTRMVYASSSIALACLETLVHTQAGPWLPLNRYLVEIIIPQPLWSRRHRLDEAGRAGWDATPPGRASQEWGSEWASNRYCLLADVPSVIVPEERNVLLNPRHPDLGLLGLRVVRRWLYDPRFGMRGHR